MADGYLRGAVS